MYDRLSFESRSSPERHPQRLAVIAHLLGVSAPKLENASILEIGCSTGANLFPVALQYSQAKLVGLDLSESQIAQANVIKDSLGLSHISFVQGDIRTFSYESQSFDYILCHGVFSWVSGDVQEAILELFEKGLRPNGVALVSYNCNPGWHMRGVTRNILSLFDNKQLTADKRIAQARSVLASGEDALVDAFRPYGLQLRDEFERSHKRSDSFFLHELLEENTSAFRVTEVVERARAHNLHYLGDAHPSRMRAEPVSRPSVPLSFDLDLLSGIEQEQLFDHLFPVALRASLFTQAASVKLTKKSLQDFYITSPLVPLSERPDIFSEQREVFCGPTELTIDVTHPLVKGALVYLRRMWPETVSFHELYEGACSLTGKKKNRKEKGAFEEELLKLFFQNLVEFYVEPLRCIGLDMQALLVSSYAQEQAQRSEWVTSERHEAFPVDPLSKYLIAELGEVSDFDTLLEKFYTMFREGNFAVQEDGEKIVDPVHLKEVVQEKLHEYLEQFAEAGLLCRA